LGKKPGAEEENQKGEI